MTNNFLSKSSPFTGALVLAVFLLFSCFHASAQFTNYQPASQITAQIPSFITPPFPDNVAFIVTSANETLSVNSSPDFRATDYGSAIWERVAWFSNTGAFEAQASGLNASLTDADLRSITMRTLNLKDVSLSTTSVGFNFRGSTTNKTTSLTLNNATYLPMNGAPSMDSASTFDIHATNGNSTIHRVVGQFKPKSLHIIVDAGASLDFLECRGAVVNPDNTQQFRVISRNNTAEVHGNLSISESYMDFPTSTAFANDGFAVRAGGSLALVGSYTQLITDKLTMQGTLSLENNTVLINKDAVLSNATVSIDSGANWDVNERLTVYGNNTITGTYNPFYHPVSLRAGILLLHDANATLTFRGDGLFQVEGSVFFRGGTIHVAETTDLRLSDNIYNYTDPWTDGSLLVDNDAAFVISQNSRLSVRNGFQLTNNGLISVSGLLEADGPILGAGRINVAGGGYLVTRDTGNIHLSTTNSLNLLNNSTTLLTLSPARGDSNRITVGGVTGLNIYPQANLHLNVVNDLHLPANTQFTLFDYPNFLDSAARFSGYANGEVFRLGLNTYRMIYNDTTVPNSGGYAITLYTQFSVYDSYWGINSGGLWTVNPDWATLGAAIGVAPGLDGSNSRFDTATFDTRGLVSGTGTVVLSTNATLTGMHFDNANASYAIAGPGTIHLTTGSTNPVITNSAGNHSISTTLDLASTVNVQTATNTRLDLGGLVTGLGGVNLSGNGTLRISGTATYAGATTISGGNFQLLGTQTGGGGISVGGGTLSGTGSTTSAVTVSGGAIQPGVDNTPGVLTVGRLQIDPGGMFNVLTASTTQVGQVQVTGPASLGGTLNVIPVNGWNLNYGDRYQVMTAGGGISGAFGTIALPQGYRGRFLLENAATVGVLLVAPATYTQVAVTPNQKSVASALNTFISVPTGDKQVLSNKLDSLTASQFSQAFEAISPTLYQSLATMAFNSVNAQYNDLVQQMFGLRVAGTGFSMSGFGDNYAVIEEGQGDGDSSKDENDILRPGPDNRWGMFVDANGIFARANSANMLQNYNSQSGGLISGLTHKWNPALTTGIYAGYQGTYAKFSGSQSGSRVINNAVRYGLLATVGDPSGKGFYGDALVGGTYNQYDVNRSIQFQGVNRTAKSSPGAGELDSLIAAGYNWRKGNWAFGPVSSLQYTYFGTNSFAESGAGSLDYQVLNWDTSSMVFNLGANCAYAWQATKNLVVVPQINLAWQHEFLQNPYSINGNLGGVPVTNTSAAPLRDTLYAGVGVTLELNKRWNSAFFYNAAAGNKNITSQNIFFSLGYKF